MRCINCGKEITEFYFIFRLSTESDTLPLCSYKCENEFLGGGINGYCEYIAVLSKWNGEFRQYVDNHKEEYNKKYFHIQEGRNLYGKYINSVIKLDSFSEMKWSENDAKILDYTLSSSIIHDFKLLK